MVEFFELLVILCGIWLLFDDNFWLIYDVIYWGFCGGLIIVVGYVVDWCRVLCGYYGFGFWVNWGGFFFFGWYFVLIWEVSVLI